MKDCLSLEQSAELIRRGVCAASASKSEVSYAYNPHTHERIAFARAIFTLADILSLLPQIFEDYYLNISGSALGWGIDYLSWHEKDPINVGSDDELIDALYSALLWCIDNNYLKLK